MNIIDGIKQKGRPYKIHDAYRSDLPEFFNQMGFKEGAEVGVLRGEFSEEICKAGLKLHAIDPWKYYGDYRRHPKEAPMEDIYQEAKAKLEPYDCTLIREESMDALKHFKDNSLDFVYLDGNHRIRWIVEDIYEWYKKIKPGGVICGHDYVNLMNNPYGLMSCHVKFAVDMMSIIYNVDFYVLGSNFGNRDKHRSWLWIKPKE